MTTARTAPSSGTAHPPAVSPDVLLWVDGRRLDPTSAAHISALDRGLTLGDGLFETMRAYQGTLFRFDRHCDRLAHGAHVLGIPLPPGVREMVGAAMREARDLGLRDAAVRITVTRGVGPRGLSPPPNAVPTVVLTMHAVTATHPAHGQRAVAVRTARGRRNEHALTAGLKTLDYIESVLALAEARAAGADDALFLDTAGHVSEATASNLFIVVGDTLITPPVACGVLPGITRAAVLELATALGITAREQVVFPDDLRAGGEAFLTSSLREIAPITAVDGRSMPNQTPGAATRRIAEAFAALVQRECAL